jgi:hypothetical protein
VIFAAGVVEEVGREVFVAVGVVEDAVALDAARIDAQLVSRLAVVARVDQHGDVVVGADDRVAVDVGRADLLGLGIVGLDADVEVLRRRSSARPSSSPSPGMLSPGEVS